MDIKVGIILSLCLESSTLNPAIERLIDRIAKTKCALCCLLIEKIESANAFFPKKGADTRQKSLVEDKKP